MGWQPRGPGVSPGLATFPVLVVALLHLHGVLPADAVLARYVTSTGAAAEESTADPAWQTQLANIPLVVDDGDAAAPAELVSLPVSLLQASVELERSPSSPITSKQDHRGVVITALASAAASCLLGLLLGFWWCTCCPKILRGGAPASIGVLPTTPSGRQIEEPVKLVNEALRLLWPAFSEIAMKAIIERAEPLVLQNVPSELQGQVAFDRAQCSLGKKPFQIPDARVCEATGTSDVANLCLEADVEWEGDCSIILSVAGVPVGIHHIVLKASVFLELVGGRKAPELFQGLRVFLTSRPELSFTFQGLSRSVESVRPVMTGAIEEMVSAWLLLPNVLGVPLSSQAEIFSLIAPPPQGVLTLTVRRTEAARAASFRVCCGAQIASSEATGAGADADLLEEVLELHIHKAELQLIELKSGNGFEGGAEFRVEDVLSWGGEEHTLDLPSDGRPGGKVGQLHLSAIWRPLLDLQSAAAARPLTQSQCCWLFLGIYGAAGVPRAGNETSEFYLKAVCSHVTAPSKEELLATLSRHARLAALRAKPGRLAVRQSPTRRVEAGAEKPHGLQQKVALLHKHRVPLDEAAQLTGLDSELLAALMRTEPPSAAAAAAEQGCRGGFSFRGRRSPHRKPVGDLTWNWPCQFVTDSPSQAELVVCLMRRGRSSSQSAAPPDDELLGSFTCSISDVLRAKHMTITTVTTLPSTGIQVSFQLQTRYCGTPRAAAEASSDGGSSSRRP